MNSNWETQKLESQYHFDNTRIDPAWDRIVELGRFVGDWKKDVENAIASARPVTWKNHSNKESNKLVSAKEFNLMASGADSKIAVSHLEYQLAPVFQKIIDIIGLKEHESRVHVQFPGQVFVKHIDKLEKFNPKDPSKIARIMIMLTDWDQGHFNQFGNFTFQGWKSGDVHTFDWQNIPHSSANAGLSPRVSLLTTGIITDKTKHFLLNSKDTIISI